MGSCSRSSGMIAVVVAILALLALFALAACSAPSASSASLSASASSSSAASVSGSSVSSASSASSSVEASTTRAGADDEGEVTISLDYNAGTGYEWTYTMDPEGVVVLDGKDTENLAEEGVAGGGLRDEFEFHAVSPGEVVITFDLVRSWEADEDPAASQVYAFTVTDDLQMILNPYKSDFENEPEWD